MGMFTSLFGSSGSSNADRLRQEAIDAFASIKTPELSDLQVQLSKYVQSGVLTPEQAETEMLKSSAFNDIVSDPSLAGAQKQALSSMQNVAKSGGLTAIDKAQLQDITNQQNQDARSRNESVMQGARERGMGGSDISTVNQLMNEQGAADRASRQGTDVAAQAQVRALQAMQAAGSTAGTIRGQDYAEQAKKAEAENAIDLFNKQTLNQTNAYNVENANKAQAANLANAQAIANANTATGNENKMYNAQQNQNVFQDQMAQASGVSGASMHAADSETAAANQDRAANAGMTSGLLQTGGTIVGGIYGGPVGAEVGGQIGKKVGQQYSDSTTAQSYAKGGEVCMEEGGEVTMDKDDFKDEHNRLLGVLGSEDPVKLQDEASRQKEEMGEQDLSRGGSVPGRALRPGNSLENDIVPAKLSPGEVVVPRSAMTDDQEFEKFMEQFRPSKKANKIDESIPMHTRALADLHKRLSNLEGK